MEAMLDWVMIAAQVLAFEFLIYGLLLSVFGNLDFQISPDTDPNKLPWLPFEYA